MGTLTVSGHFDSGLGTGIRGCSNCAADIGSNSLAGGKLCLPSIKLPKECGIFTVLAHLERLLHRLQHTTCRNIFWRMSLLPCNWEAVNQRGLRRTADLTGSAHLGLERPIANLTNSSSAFMCDNLSTRISSEILVLGPEHTCLGLQFIVVSVPHEVSPDGVTTPVPSQVIPRISAKVTSGASRAITVVVHSQ